MGVLNDEALEVAIRYLGGSTAVLDYGGLRFLIDPTFDPAGEYPGGSQVLIKTMDAPTTAAEVGPVDAVLLSHDQHPDNLDGAGRDYLATAPLVLSTAAAEERLGGTVRALPPWQVIEVTSEHGVVRVTGVPARHGPVGSEPLVGEVTGFVISGDRLPTVYVSGDNAALEHVGAVADRFDVGIAVIFAGGARTALLEGAYLTLTADRAARAAALLDAADVVPLHFEGWAHFSQGRDSVAAAFTRAGLDDRLRLLDPGERIELTGRRATPPAVARTTLLDAQLASLRADHIEIRRIELPPDCVPGAHTHNGPVVGSILTGTVTLQVAGAEPQVLGPGDIFFEPADVVIDRFDAGPDGATFLGYFPLPAGTAPELTMVEA